MVIKHIKVVSHTRKERRTLTKKVNNIIKLVDKARYNKRRARNIAIVVGIAALVVLAAVGVVASIPHTL